MAASLKKLEIAEMARRAISSSGFHGIQLQHGRSNPANGDCAFEAIIFNNNDRKCFKSKFNMSIDHYRRIWTTDMANRTVNSPWIWLVIRNDLMDGRICQIQERMNKKYLET